MYVIIKEYFTRNYNIVDNTHRHLQGISSNKLDLKKLYLRILLCMKLLNFDWDSKFPKI